jgi:transposase
MSGAPWNTTDTERLRALASAGLSLSEIAIEMERSKQVIRTWAEKLKIAIAKSRHPRQRQMRLETARLQRVDLEAKLKKAQI